MNYSGHHIFPSSTILRLGRTLLIVPVRFDVDIIVLKVVQTNTYNSEKYNKMFRFENQDV